MGKTNSTHWLSKDEQRLLKMLYYKQQQLMRDYSIPFNEMQQYEIVDLVRAFQTSNIKRNVPFLIKPIWEKKLLQDFQEKNKSLNMTSLDYLHARRHIFSLSIALQADKLIITDLQEPEQEIMRIERDLRKKKEIAVSFTRDGYKLAEDYTHVWHWLRLWYNHFIRHHPVIVIFAYFFGVVTMFFIRLIIHWLTKSPRQ